MHILFVQRCHFELRGRSNLVHSPKYYSPIFVDDQFAKVFSCQNFPLHGKCSYCTIPLGTCILQHHAQPQQSWHSYTVLTPLGIWFTRNLDLRLPQTVLIKLVYFSCQIVVNMFALLLHLLSLFNYDLFKEVSGYELHLLICYTDM